jgi:hypothetical protein
MAWYLIQHRDNFTFIFTTDTEATERSSVDLASQRTSQIITLTPLFV